MSSRLLLPTFLSVSLSVCLSVTRLRCAKTAEQIEVLVDVKIFVVPMNIVLDVGPDPPTARGSGKRIRCSLCQLTLASRYCFSFLFYRLLIIVCDVCDDKNKSTRKTTQTWQDNIKTWTGLSLAEAVRAMKDRSQWSKIVHDATKPSTAKKG